MEGSHGLTVVFTTVNGATAVKTALAPTHTLMGGFARESGSTANARSGSVRLQSTNRDLTQSRNQITSMRRKLLLTDNLRLISVFSYDCKLFSLDIIYLLYLYHSLN
jgi:hypothetical protein